MKAILIQKTSEKPVDKNYRFIEHKMLEINVDGLKDMQKAVEGDIESWNYISKLYRNGIVMYCNDEGKINKLTPSVVIKNPDDEIVELICGNTLLVGYDFSEDLSVSLTDEQIQIIREVFQEAVISTGKNIIKLFSAKI